MDENPPDINGHRREEKNKALCESIKLWRKRAWSWLKACFTVDNLKLFVKILIASSPIIGAFYFLIIEIKTDIQTTVTAVNQIDASITAAVSSMATSLSSANAKSDSQAIVHNNTFPLGSGNATIYHKFQNPVQACWYYAATYRTQHPYTVLWENFSFEKQLKIRVIASKGVWKAHTCQRDNEVDLEKIKKLLREGDARIEESVIEDILKVAEDYKNITDIKEEIENKISDNINKFRIIGLIRKPNTIVKLIGEETINHRLEATFYTQEEKDKWNQNRSEYSHIADTVATYYSTLHFDNEGKIAHRRVKNTSDYKCKFPDSFDEKALSLSNEICTQIKKPSDNPDNSDSKEYKNEVEILKVKTSSKESEDYNMALKFYLERRKDLHDNLTYDGCGAISVEPDFVAGDLPTGELETPSLVFLCHKNNNRSHVRIMVRENQQQKKEREDKTIQEAKKEWQKMNEQSSEEKHKGSFLRKRFIIF